MDVQHIPGVGACGHGPVEGVFPNQVEGTPAQGVNLVVDEDIAGAGEGKEQLIEVVEMQAAHIPGLVMVELQMKFDICHGLSPLVQDTHIIPRQENICKLFAKLLIDILQIL